MRRGCGSCSRPAKRGVVRPLGPELNCAQGGTHDRFTIQSADPTIATPLAAGGSIGAAPADCAPLGRAAAGVAGHAVFRRVRALLGPAADAAGEPAGEIADPLVAHPWMGRAGGLPIRLGG